MICWQAVDSEVTAGLFCIFPDFNQQSNLPDWVVVGGTHVIDEFRAAVVVVGGVGVGGV